MAGKKTHVDVYKSWKYATNTLGSRSYLRSSLMINKKHKRASYPRFYRLGLKK
jgi:hypothetical protein